MKYLWVLVVTNGLVPMPNETREPMPLDSTVVQMEFLSGMERH